MVNGRTALTTVVDAVKYPEDDPRFNAVFGSKLRVDGQTIQLDASCMTSNNEFDAVTCIENIKSPIALSQGFLLHSPHILIAQDGARIFAEEYHIPITGLSGSDQIETPGTSCVTVGAFACTGDGEFIALKILAKEVYTQLENSISPDKASQKAMTLFDDGVDIGLIILTRTGFAANALNGMPWSHMTESK